MSPVDGRDSDRTLSSVRLNAASLAGPFPILGLDGTDVGQASDVNDNGWIVGISRPSAGGALRPTLWKSSGEIIDLSTLQPAGFQKVAGISNTGWIAGTTNFGGGQAIRWLEGSSSPELLGTPSAVTSLRVTGVNKSGHLSASGRTPSGRILERALRWTDAAGWQVLGSGLASNYAAEDIGNSGTIAGASPSGSESVASRNVDPFWLTIGTLPGTPLNDLTSRAMGISDDSPQRVVGWSERSSRRAFYWDKSVMLQELPPLSPGGRAEAFAVNNDGYSVGRSRAADGILRATLWMPNGQAIQLEDDPDAVQSDAVAISNSGVIVGHRFQNGWHLLTWTLAGQRTPEDIIASLGSDVEALIASGVLKKKDGKALTKKLDKAAKKLAKGKTTSAVKKLQAFINKVEKFRKAGKLSDAQAQPLIDDAHEAIDLLVGASSGV